MELNLCEVIPNKKPNLEPMISNTKEMESCVESNVVFFGFETLPN